MKPLTAIALAAVSTVIVLAFSGCGPKTESVHERSVAQLSDVIFTGVVLQSYDPRIANVPPGAKAVVIEIEKLKKGRPKEKLRRNVVYYIVDDPSSIFVGYEDVPAGERFVFYVLQKDVPRPMIILAEPVE